MELAKIRQKALQEAEPELELHLSQTEAAAQQVEADALEASPKAEQPVDTTTASLPAANTVVLRPAALPDQADFNPLAKIMAGRKQANLEALLEKEPEPEQESEEQQLQEFLCFRLGQEEYGINIMVIKEIIKPRGLTEVPRAPDFIDGVLSLRGLVVPVFAMRKRLGMSLEYDPGLERIVIVRNNDGLYGLRVDCVTDVVRIYQTAREGVPAVLEGQAREFVNGIGRADGRMLILLDIPKVVEVGLEEYV